MKSFLHHLEFEKSGLKKEDLKKMIYEKKIIYNHNIDQKGYKWSDKTTLENINNDLLPSYIVKNMSKFKEWLD